MEKSTDVFVEVEFEAGEREANRYEVPNRADGQVLGSKFYNPIAKLRRPNTDHIAYVYCLEADTYLIINQDGDKVCAIPRSFFYALRRLPGPDEKDQSIRNVYTLSPAETKKLRNEPEKEASTEGYEIVPPKTTLVMARATLVSGNLVRQVRMIFDPKLHTVEELFAALCTPENTEDGKFGRLTVDHIRLEPENTVTYSSD